MASWGDVNVGLNGLVREGLISRFGTNLGDLNRSGPITVTVVPADGFEETVVRGAVARALARLGLVAEIALEPSAERRAGSTEPG
jgi:hypothetical protein